MYAPHSELAAMREGTGQSEYWNSASIRLLRENLDLGLEAALGYSYDEIFSRCGRMGAPSGSSFHLSQRCILTSKLQHVVA